MTTTIKLIAFGDTDTTGDADDVLTALMKETGVSQYLFLGDGPYAKSGTKWTSMMSKYFDETKKKMLMISRGNHDEDESESKTTQKDIESWMPELKALGISDTWLAAKQVGNVYIINMDTQDLDIEFKRDQYNWVVSELQKAKQLRSSGAIDWIIVLFHKPSFTLKSSHSPYTAMRFLYKDIFADAQVDFALSGHNHNTQLWLPMIPNESEANGEGEQLFTLAADNKTFDFSKLHGILYIVNGISGHEFNSINDSGSGVKNVQFYRDDAFGYTSLEIDGKKAKVLSKLVDGKVDFEYNVTKEGSGTVDPPVKCKENECKDPTTNKCRPIGTNETVDSDGFCKTTTIPPDPNKIVCPIGWHAEPALGHCLPDLNPKPGEPVCPSGYKWNKTKKVCERDGTVEPPKCKDDEHWDPVQKKCVKNTPDPEPCKDNECKDPTTNKCRAIGTNERKNPTTGYCEAKPVDPDPNGEIDEHGIKWLVAKGKKTIVVQSRDEATDDRWSGNVKGLMNGFESTFIGKSHGTNSSSHFAMKQFSGNHSGSGSEKNAWYDTGLRVDGEVQLQTEFPHPNNHDFDLPDANWFIKKISKGLEGNWIGLKWCVMLVKPGGTRKDGIRLRMWVDEDPLDENNKPRNNWKLVYDFIDTGQVIPADKQLVDEQDCEIRRSDTDSHDVYGDGKIITGSKKGDPGLHVRALS